MYILSSVIKRCHSQFCSLTCTVHWTASEGVLAFCLTKLRIWYRKVYAWYRRSMYGIIQYSIAQLNSWKEHFISIWLCTQCCLSNKIYLFSIIHGSIFTNLPRKVNFALLSTNWICYKLFWNAVSTLKTESQSRVQQFCSEPKRKGKYRAISFSLFRSPSISLPVSLMPSLSVSLSIWIFLVVSL